MSNENELRRLTWKYFWKRKREEVWKFIKDIIPVLLFFTIILSGAFWGATFMSISSGADYPLWWISVCKPIFFISITINIMLILISWLYSNWKLATKDAVKEIKRRTNNERNKS